MPRHAALALTLLAGLAAAPATEAAIIFDNTSRSTLQSNRVAGSSPLALITVAAPTVIDQIGVQFDPGANGNLKFLIFSLDTATPLFQTPAEAFTDVGTAVYLSAVFAGFTLNPGITYAIGGIADVSGSWNIDTVFGNGAFTQNGITAIDDSNGNVSNFATPRLGVLGGGMSMLQLGRTPETAVPETAVPEPASLALLGMGLLGLAGAMRRRGA